MFLDLDRVWIAIYGGFRELSDFIKNIIICVLKMNGGLTGLKRPEGGWVINYWIFIFGWTIPLNEDEKTIYQIVSWASKSTEHMWKNNRGKIFF